VCRLCKYTLHEPPGKKTTWPQSGEKWADTKEEPNDDECWAPKGHRMDINRTALRAQKM